MVWYARMSVFCYDGGGTDGLEFWEQRLLLLLKQPRWALGAGTVLVRMEDWGARYTRAMVFLAVITEGWAGTGAVMSDE